jgi:protein-tyrosine phosphatase
MAEAMFRHVLEERRCDGIETVSAGTWAAPGYGATTDAADVLSVKGIDLTQHKSRALEKDELRAADLVVAMTSVHAKEIAELDSEAADKTMFIKSLARLDAQPHGATTPDRLQELLALPRPPWRRELDVDDPMGLPRSAYERAMSEIEGGVVKLADFLCPLG